MEEAIRSLEMLEEAVAKSSGRHGELRKRADALYQERVGQLARAHGCDERRAHALAATDPVASRAYALGSELAESERRSIGAGMRAAAYVG